VVFGDATPRSWSLDYMMGRSSSRFLLRWAARMPTSYDMVGELASTGVALAPPKQGLRPILAASGGLFYVVAEASPGPVVRLPIWFLGRSLPA